MVEVACAIIFNEGKILLTQRSEKMKLPLKWEFPGGKIEAGETAEKCIVREINEELGIAVKPIKKLDPFNYKYPEFEILLIPVICTSHDLNINLKEHKQFTWAKLEQLYDFDLAPADIPIVDFLKKEPFLP